MVRAARRDTSVDNCPTCPRNASAALLTSSRRFFDANPDRSSSAIARYSSSAKPSCRTADVS
jgi:hypothetical protein